MNLVSSQPTVQCPQCGTRGDAYCDLMDNGRIHWYVDKWLIVEYRVDGWRSDVRRIALCSLACLQGWALAQQQEASA